MKNTVLSYLLYFLFVGLIGACQKNPNNPPKPEPEDTIKSTPKIGDPDYFFYGDVKVYDGKYHVTDSVLASGSSIDDPNPIWEYDRTITKLRHYWVKQEEDTIYISFTITSVYNTYHTLTPDLLNGEGWYIASNFSHFKFSNDSLFVNGDFIVPAYVFGYFIKRTTRYIGVLE